MAFIDKQLIKFKELIEDSIKNGGTQGKTSMIRSSVLINLIHDAVKKDLIDHGIDPSLIYPHFGESKPEIKLAGFLKQKDQDVCVVPRSIPKHEQIISWGPMAFQHKSDPFGFDYSTNTLVINVRSQMSSLAKNSDTLFERTFAEAQNLHQQYPNIVLGEVYLIPVNEYDDSEVKFNRIAFKEHRTDLQKYICFFDSINNRELNGDAYKYERCALLIVDFQQSPPKLYNSTKELINDGLLPHNFSIEYENLSFRNFTRDILRTYSERFDISNLK